MPNGARRYVFTSFNISEPPTYDGLSMRYMCYGVETCPETGRKHLQGFVCFSGKRSFAKAKASIGTSVHIEVARGSVTDNTQYCSKDGDFHEFGERPTEQTENAAIANKKRYQEAYEKAREGNFKAISPDILIHCYGNLKRIREDAQLESAVRSLPSGTVAGLWLYGYPGLGKSFWVRNTCEQLGLTYYYKQLNKWWDGYLDQQIVVLEDVDHTNSKWMGWFLKIWADEGWFMAETKGGTRKIRPRAVVVTSNYLIDDLFGLDLASCAAIKRRYEQPLLNTRSDLDLCTYLFEITLENGISTEEVSTEAAIPEI